MDNDLAWLVLSLLSVFVPPVCGLPDDADITMEEVQNDEPNYTSPLPRMLS